MPIGYRVQTYNTTGTMQSWNLDHAIVPMNTAVRVTVNASTASYGLQYNLAPLGPTDPDSTGNWIADPNIPASTTALAASTTFATPVARIRLVIAALTGTATVTMEALQSMSTN